MKLPTLELLHEAKHASAFPLPAALRAAYGGDLGFQRPRVFANFVSSVDGVVALAERAESGGIISGHDDGDRFVMGLLRACAEGLQLLLTEGGPTLVGRLLAEDLLDELFLTTSPLLLGRHGGDNRKSLVDGVDLRAAGSGKLALSSVRRRGSFLYLRYSISRP